jgi:glycosyltransferase involved in cell wall biosynthesis
MKILHVVHTYAPSQGGAQWLIKNLSEQLVARWDDDVTVYTTTALTTEQFRQADRPTLPPGTEIMAGVKLRRFPVFNHLSTVRMLLAAVAYRLHLPYNDWLRTFYNGPIVPGLSKAVASSGADIVLATSFPLLHMYYAIAGARRAGIPIILLGAIHTADPWGYERANIYRAVGQVDAYIALTAYERDYLIRRAIPPGKISVIGPGVDAASYLRADGVTERNRLGWGDEPVVAVIAKQTARKRLDVVIEAMCQVWETRPEARLLIAGATTPYSSYLQQRIEALPAERRGRVTVIDDFSEDRKPGLLAACNIFVLPSSEESFGIAFLEAWAARKPVIGADAGAIPSVIEDGRAGMLVPYGDSAALAGAISRLLASPSLRGRLGEAGHQKVLKQYTWEAVCDQVRALYESVVVAGREGSS